MASSSYGAVQSGLVSVRHDIMGRGRVVELLSKRALLSTDRGDVLITPQNTYNDKSIDLTERLRKDDDVVYKALKIAENSSVSSVRYVAVYVRRLSNCAVGSGTISSVYPNYAFCDTLIKNNKFEKVFFPRSGLFEPSIEHLLRRGSFEFTKLLRHGDSMTFVAVQDASTKEKSAYGIEVSFNFNQNLKVGGWIYAIVAEVRKKSIDVWAKNFHRDFIMLTAEEHFGIRDEPDFDMRNIFECGTRIRFKSDGGTRIKNLEITDEKEKAAMKPFLDKMERKSREREEYWHRLDDEMDSGGESEKEEETGQWPKNDLPLQAAAEASSFPSESTNDKDFMRQLEEELNEMFPEDEPESEPEPQQPIQIDQQFPAIESQQISTPDESIADETYKAASRTPSRRSSKSYEFDSPVWPSSDLDKFSTVSQNFVGYEAKSESNYSNRSNLSSGFVATKDAACQANLPSSVDLLKELLEDEEIFKLTCQKYNGLVHDIWKTLRW